MSIEARVRLAHTGMHPDRRRSLEAEYGGPDGVVDAIRYREIRVPDAVRTGIDVDADSRRAALPEGIRLILRGEEGFPRVLEALPDGPDHLFAKGGPLTDRPTVGVVGSRRATSYGLRVAERLGAALGGSGVVVTSGLARGIDGAAHRGVVDAGGVAWAVLGCGVDRWYPVRHAQLGEAILDAGGTVVSEYPPGTTPVGWRFPPRNRIISGLASAVVIVEAAVTGGALITARLAMDQGREVFAVPGDIDREVSEGCNRLIADGAIPVTSIDDLLEGLGFLRAANPTQPTIPGLEELGPLGATFDELSQRLGLGPREVLARVGRWEALGMVRRQADRVVPI